ncbi:hypothetical protein AB0A76_03760 [Streptomyces exfoliatus]|uniref:Secreted protein n=1 Tax=Streptomyces exfoliatus TaxID=1905 RepID=A0ABV3CQ25_STREX
MKLRRVTLASLLTVGALATSACQSQETGADQANLPEREAFVVSDSLTVSDPPAVDGAEIPPFPIEKYLPKVGEDSRIAAASGEIIRECMAGFQLRYQPPAISQEALDSEENGANRMRRYGVSSSTVSTVNGYHLPKGMTGDFAPAQQGSQMSETERKVFIGDKDPTVEIKPGEKVNGKEIPSGGCSGEAQRRLKFKPRQRMAEKINNMSFAQSQENKQVKKAFQDWAACMTRSGYSYKTPMEPLEKIEGSTPAATEIATANADVRCKESTNLVGIWFAIESKIQEELIARNEEALAEDGKVFDALIRRASEELAQP